LALIESKDLLKLSKSFTSLVVAQRKYDILLDNRNKLQAQMLRAQERGWNTENIQINFDVANINL